MYLTPATVFLKFEFQKGKNRKLKKKKIQEASPFKFSFCPFPNLIVLRVVGTIYTNVSTAFLEFYGLHPSRAVGAGRRYGRSPEQDEGGGTRQAEGCSRAGAGRVRDRRVLRGHGGQAPAMLQGQVNPNEKRLSLLFCVCVCVFVGMKVLKLKSVGTQ